MGLAAATAGITLLQHLLQELNVPLPAAPKLWLLIVDRLLKWGIQADPKCALCHYHDEYLGHMFVQCPFARNLWKRLLDWPQGPMMAATTWDQYMSWAISNAKGKSLHTSFFKIILAECVHSIWTERNARLFEGRSTAYDAIAKVIAYSCYVRAVPVMQKYLLRFSFLVC
ncbi:uncharacterized protein LOC132640394 [Lycium barbarum]|uniref:uncharacterized protein LOC132640394 n=1 Tax=Lycium barbarum TaxID=112863 RepID=UPI00293E9B96|nr:uncharacterized protein LOC132640394 [Lycium barbarum]XP_060212958.1 uncharacterized protein LOC132640394 [Lycium barbarum]XP_060212959.1 uncharacterized protein LOC132640394 [Lycium barbarum]